MNVKEFEMTDRIAVVTGAGRGIGREVAVALAEAGASIACTDIDGAASMATAQHLLATFGGDHAAFTVDVRDSTTVNALHAQVAEAFGHVDVLVNNAGSTRNAAAEAITDEDWHDVIEVNLTGVFFASRVFGASRGREWMAMTPAGRLGTARDVALAVMYLASDAAAYVTGANLVVDGGYTAW